MPYKHIQHKKKVFIEKTFKFDDFFNEGMKFTILIARMNILFSSNKNT